MSDWDFPKVTLEVLNDIKNLSLYIETLPSIINANLGGSIHTLIFLSMLAIPLITIIQAFFIVDLQHLIETALMNIFGQFWLFLQLILQVRQNMLLISTTYYINFNFLGLSVEFGIDGISLIFIALTLYISPFTVLALANVEKNTGKFLVYSQVVILLLILTFSTTSIPDSYIFPESILIPMFLLIGIWGSGERKIRASFFFFLYTLFGSLFMFSGIPHPYNIRGSLVFSTIFNNIYSNSQQNILFGCLFSAPATKIPLFPFHTRLPEAHAEAPTIGSVILASLLSKLGGYGFLRSSIVICPNAVIFFHTVLYTTAVPGVIYGSLTTLRQTDLKRIIAYSPVAHMNAMTVGLFSSTQQGIDGAIFLMISHGIVSSAPFFCVGFVYDRYHTRLVKYYGGLVITMPIFTTFLLVFSLANMGFPLTSNFIGEILSFCGLFQLGPLITMLVATGIILSAMYSIRLFNRIAFGTPKLRYISSFRDLNRSETSILTILAVTTLIMGINAALILEYTTLKCNIAGDNKPP